MQGKKQKKHSYFYNMLLILFITIFLTSFVLTLFSYTQFSEAIREKTYAGYQSALRKNARSWIDLSSEITQLKYAVTADRQTEAYFALQEFDGQQDYYTYLKVKKLFNINTFVTTICLYNDVAGEALYCGTDDIPFEALWDRMKQENSSFVCLAETSYAQDGSMIVFGYPVYSDSFDSPQGAIFICLDMQKVCSHVMGEGEYGQILFNAESEVLLYQNTGDEEGDIRSWAVLQSEPWHNESLITSQGEFLCSYYSEGDISLVSYVSYEDMKALITGPRNVFLLVCMVVVTIGALLQFCVVRKVYQPIESIRRVFENSRFAQEESQNEFQLIQQVYQSAMSQINELESRNAMFLPKLRTDLLRGVILGNIKQEQAEETMAEYGFKIPFSGMFLGIAAAEGGQECGLRRDMIMGRFKQCIMEEAGEEFWIECIAAGSNEMIVLINTKEERKTTFEYLVDKLERVMSGILQEYEVQMTIALDGVMETMEDCHGVYLRVRELQKNQFALGMNQVIYPGRVQALLPEPLVYPDKLMHEILILLNQKDPDSYQVKIDDFLDMISQYTYQPASIMFARLYLECVAKVQKYKVTGRSMAPDVEMKMNPATKEEARQLLRGIYEVYQIRRKEAEEAKGNKHYGKIMKSQEYIREMHGDSNLCVDSIAETFGYSANYFARLFKTITGYYVNDYIRQIRILNAQRLLQESDRSINEIAEAAGFTTSNYFYAIFKKETGMTPAAYREENE